jgi:hypothetical protein
MRTTSKKSRKKKNGEAKIQRVVNNIKKEKAQGSPIVM